MYHLAFITLALTLLVDTFFGLTVLLRVYQKAFGWYFVLTVFGLILWVIGDAGLLFARDVNSVHTFAEFFYIAPMITPISIWFFALSFPENRPLPKWAPWLGAPPLVILSTLFLWRFNFFIRNIAITQSLNIATPAKPGFYLYSAFFSFFFILVYIAFFIKLRQLKGISRSQVRYTFVGVLVGSFLALVSNLSLPTLGIRELIWLGPFFTLFFPASVAAAIIKHRLFDIRFVLARSVGYVFALTGLAIAYVLVALTLVNRLLFRNSHVPAKQQLVYAILAAILAFSFQPLRRFLEKGTNRIFYRDAYDPQEFFDSFNKALVSTIDLDDLLKRVAAVIAANLKSQYAVVGVRDSEGTQRIIGTQRRSFSQEEIMQVRRITPHMHQTVIMTDDIGAEHLHLQQLLQKNDVAVLARITDDVNKIHEGLGYIALGPKKSGNPYTVQDSRVLEATTNELVIAIQNALRFEEIERFNVTLQQKVEEATKKLRETNKRLKLLDETKDDFISMASHQLRTPLTAVKGYISLVLDGDAGPVKESQRKLLTQAFFSSQRMVYLIADLLNVSRLRTGKFVVEPSAINLASIVEDEVAQLVETAKGRGLALNYHKPAHFPTLQLDETKTRQVIMNFIDNAIYYTPAGGHIDVFLNETPKSIELKVVDDGIGVPKIEQHHLFSKFFRAKNAQKARPDGTGLGLFMAKKVVIAQGGAIIFNSQPGNKGSTFGFTFPKSALAKTGVTTEA